MYSQPIQHINIRPMKKCILFCIATVLTACANKHSYEPVRERVSLSGEWETTLGACLSLIHI